MNRRATRYLKAIGIDAWHLRSNDGEVDVVIENATESSLESMTPDRPVERAQNEVDHAELKDSGGNATFIDIPYAVAGKYWVFYDSENTEHKQLISRIGKRCANLGLELRQETWSYPPKELRTRLNEPIETAQAKKLFESYLSIARARTVVPIMIESAPSSFYSDSTCRLKFVRLVSELSETSSSDLLDIISKPSHENTTTNVIEFPAHAEKRVQLWDVSLLRYGSLGILAPELPADLKHLFQSVAQWLNNDPNVKMDHIFESSQETEENSSALQAALADPSQSVNVLIVIGSRWYTLCTSFNIGSLQIIEVDPENSVESIRKSLWQQLRQFKT